MIRVLVIVAAVAILTSCVLIPPGYQCDKPGGGVFFGLLCEEV